MGLKYLWDTNTVVHYLLNQLPISGDEFVDKIADNSNPIISVITEIELLCWRLATENDIIVLNNFIANSEIYQLDNDIKLKTIEIRKKFKIKLPDAIIAASAIVNKNILITRNTSDFNKISELEIVDPFAIS